MFKHKVIKTVPGKSNRSDFHHLVIRGLHGSRTAKAERDIFGAALVVILTAAVVFLVRLALAN